MVTQVRPAGLNDWLASVADQGRPLVLDVREPRELALARITPEAGFDVLEIPMGVIPLRLPDIPGDRPIACLCHHGGRSMQVAMFLRAHGYPWVANVLGGINAWAHERDPSLGTY